MLEYLSQEERQWLRESLDKFVKKMESVRERAAKKIPFSAREGVYDDHSDAKGINWWTNGFWGGMMWQLYQETQDPRYMEIARYSEDALDQCFEQFMGLHHDVGFMWMPTSVADYRKTGNPEGRRRGLHAATLLAGRFNPVGRFIRAWNDEWHGHVNTGWAIIDCMMNLSLLYWASEELDDPRFRQIAMMHADTALEHFIRPDGSVNHIVEFDPETGIETGTHGGQGYGTGSSWTRGQGWAIYGFAISYRHTGKQEYLDAAKRVAHYFISNIPENGRIPIDFRMPKEPYYEDSTAAAIASCGLLEIARFVDELQRPLYLGAALKLLRALTDSRCDWDPERDGILEKCSGSYSEEKHEYNIIYGDYYLLEALLKLEDHDLWIW
mgnify:CR=1 FL=1